MWLVRTRTFVRMSVYSWRRPERVVVEIQDDDVGQVALQLR